MKINLGSKNPTKITAVEETLAEYDFLANTQVTGIATKSGVSEQPKSIEETIQGAKNRAIAAFTNCKYSFGIESGLIKVPGTKTGYMDTCICVIYDGKNTHLGMSSAFECPPEMIKLIFEEGLDINQATQKMGMTDDPKVGNAGGLINILTKGHVTRKDYTKQSIRMAIIHLQNPDLY